MRTLLCTLLLLLSVVAVSAQTVRIHLTQTQLAELVPESQALYEEAKDLTDHMRHLEAVAHLHRAAELSPDSIPLQRLTAQVAQGRIDRADSDQVETLCQVAILAHQRIRVNPLATEIQVDNATEQIGSLLEKIDSLQTERTVRNRYTRSIDRIHEERQILLEQSEPPEIIEHSPDPEAERLTPHPDLGESYRPSDSTPPPPNENRHLPPERP